MRVPWALCAVTVVAAIAAGEAQAQTATVVASAGLGGVPRHGQGSAAGIVKSGRWTPVQVLVTADEDVTGELVVSWGTATLRRRVDLIAPATRRFELYIRTSEVESAVDVRLQTGGTVVAQTSVPVRVLRQAEPVTVCVTGADGTAGPDACTTTVPADRLPASSRGYEAADAVVLTIDETLLAAEQQQALRVWRAIRRLDESGDLGLTGQVARPELTRGLPRVLLGIVALLAVAYAAALVASGLELSRRARRVSFAYGVLALVTVAGSAAAAAVGAGVPQGDVVVHHRSLLQQVPGTSVSMLTVRGLAEFPAFRPFALRWPAADGVIEPASATGFPESMFDAEGFPVLAGTYGLGNRRAFSGEAIVETQVLSVDMQGDALSIVNRSQYDLRDCQLADGVRLDDGALRAGASVRVGLDEDILGPLVTCVADMAFLPLTEGGGAAAMAGTTTVAVYR